MPRDFLDRWLGVATQESMYSVMYVEFQPNDDVLSALECLDGLEFLSIDDSKLSIENIRAIPELSGVVEFQIRDEESELSKDELRNYPEM